MGLDITAYKNVRKIDCVFNGDGEPIDPVTKLPISWDEYFRPYNNPHFAGRIGPLTDKAVYLFDDSIGFRAGSYSGYNRWRETLSEITQESGRFQELINFSDCEGTIAGEACVRLAKDFAEFQPEADKVEEEWWRSKYSDWRGAFEMAAQNGAVDFH